jgi:membrane-associated PAP2 superfamily phosphatase
MFANIPHDVVRFARITFRPTNIPIFVGMAVLTTALVATDDETWHLSDRFYHNAVSIRNGSDFFEYLGDGRPQFGLAAGFALYGFALRDQRALRTGSQLVEGILSCGVVVQTLKHITGRQSPYVSTVPGGVWDFFPNQIDYHKHVPSYDAYPSGHISTAMATVTIVAENYPEWKWVRPVGYVVVGLIGVSMANTGIHWYSDYPLGIALGYCFGMIVSHPEGLEIETKSDGNSPVVSFAPVINSHGTGLGVELSF